jgi:hypothetical protein
MHVHRFVRTFALVLGLSALSGGSSPYVLAQGAAHAHERRDADQKHSPGALVAIVREATERFKNVAAAEAEGYGLQFGCVSGPDSGAMGLHYVNFPLVLDGELDPAKPEIVIYEPIGNGKVKMIGADYLVLADAWHATHTGPPELMGQLLHYFEAPNRFGLPAFYTLHVWAWKENPTGMFVNWHSNVSCDSFPGRND